MESKNIFNGILEKFTNLLDKTKNKTYLQLLEPLSTIIRLSILYFNIEGTKIAIYNNRIFSQKPSFIQGTSRFLNGHKRNELHYLYKPIIKATQQYNPNNEDIKVIFEFAIKGLEKLKTTYKNKSGTIICHSIDLYKESIQKTIDQEKTTKNNNNSKKNKNNTDINQEKICCDELTDSLYDDFYNLWDKEQIKIVSDLLKLAHKHKNDKNTSLSFIQSIDSIIQNKEKLSLNLINKATENIIT